MANTKFQIKRSAISGRLPNTSDPANTAYIDAGELAINLVDKKVYSSNGTVSFEIGANLTSIAVSGNATFSSIIANGSVGTDGQVLASNGSTIYWETVAGGGGPVEPVFPTGDYSNGEVFVGEVSLFDAFGVLIVPFFDCMSPSGQPISANTSVDLGLLT